MSLPLGVVLAKIITNECESTIVKELVDNSLTKLSTWTQYVTTFS